MSQYSTHELGPEQREAAEKLLGQSLSNFQQLVIQVEPAGSEIVVRFMQGQQEPTPVPQTGDWKIPACFDVLTDLSADEAAEYDAVISEPVKLS